ncbi:MAG: undecaprenyl-diphosphate phosphatase [Holosporaceae bacterium]|jgi:undecaprenyl-diphosphatase|nr:undecaprenyl-diphosphate phosphatase [Holosporaceae bacterium]
MSLIEAVFLGAIQGITEFLPVSSSAHLVIIPKLLGITYQGKEFDIFLNIGSLLAVIVYFRLRVWSILQGINDFVSKKKTENRYFFVTIFLSSLPVIVVFGILEILFEVDVNSRWIMFASTLFFSIVLYFCDQKENSRENISRKDSILVGAAQILSFFPGASRLGLCLSVLRYKGCLRDESFKYSMLLSIPPVTGACFLKLLKVFTGKIVVENWTCVIIGAFSAFICGLIFVDFVVKFLKRHSLLPIIIYRLLSLGTLL